MSKIKGKNTKPELLLRHFIYSKGLRGYRIKTKLVGKPDIVFTKHKLVVFVDGCFWHKCPEHFKTPETNKMFWIKKINTNVLRDLQVRVKLTREGWKVLSFWEHEVIKDSKKCYNQIVKTLKKRNIQGNR